MLHQVLVQLRGIDFGVLSWAVHLTANSTWFSRVVEFCAQELIFFFPLILLYLWERPERDGRRHGSKKTVILAILTMVLAVSAKTFIDFLYTRPRPFISHPDLWAMTFRVDQASFPSGHTLMAFSLAASIYFSGHRRVGGVSLFLALLIGLGRIFSGVHYPSDVLAGALIGIGSAWYLHREASTLRKYLPDR